MVTAPTRRDDMESLAYTLVKLLTGTLPWADTRTDEELLPIVCAHSGRTLCAGYHDVFARFVDYARGLQYEDAPRYKDWINAFRELVPGLSDDALFDPDDASEPRVGVQKTSGLDSDLNLDFDRLRLDPKSKSKDPEPPKPKPQPQPLNRADSDARARAFEKSVLGGSSRSREGGRHGFLPNLGSTWSCGEAIPAGDLFGEDEFAIVAGAGVEFVDAPPEYTRGSCTYPGASAPETMRNAQSDTRCI